MEAISRHGLLEMTIVNDLESKTTTINIKTKDKEKDERYKYLINELNIQFEKLVQILKYGILYEEEIKSRKSIIQELEKKLRDL